MSDFDKEAEREKLREKYERDEQERKATQRMSDLLLKGATMTNAHCGTCGDPLFQMDGTTFCPSCHGTPDAVEGTDLEAQLADEEQSTETGRPAGDAPGETGAGTPADGDADRAPPSSGAGDSDADDDGATQPKRQRRPQGRPADADATADPSTAPDSHPSREESTTDAAPSADRRSGGRPAAPSRPAGGDLEAAHASLVGALEKFADKAATTDDPRHARECLEAAREAAETLETLR